MLGDLAARASLRNRRRKLALFLEAMRPGPETRVVDVGVGDTPFGTEPGVAATHNFFEALYPWPERITAVSTQHLDRFSAAFPRVTAVRADGRELPFADGEFDLGFSNAVLEHVGGREDQRAFVRELCRVAGRVFLATPNRRFPLDPHTLVPLAHWLRAEQRDGIYRRLGRTEGIGVQLLSPGDLLALFPPETRPRLVRRGMNLVVVTGA